MSAEADRLGQAQIRAICAAVDARFEEQVVFLGDLVRHASLRQNEAGVQAMLAKALAERGYAVERFAIDASLIGSHPAFSPSTIDCSQAWNIVGVRRPVQARGRSLALNAHVDVVPTGRAGSWRSPPFDPLREGDWLYGRGAGDMKAGMAANIFAIDAVRAAGFELQGEVQIQSVVEEESTGNGAAMMLARGYTADAILISEPTDERLVRANSGVFKFAVTAYGIPTHPRDPASGRSAIDLAIRLIEHLKRLEECWNAERSRHPLFAPIDNPVALTIGTIAGGEWIASTPSECRIEGRVGFYPGDSPGARAREFEDFVAAAVRDDPAFAGCARPAIEWVGVMHAGYELVPGSDAEIELGRAHRHVAEDATELQAHVMACYLDAAVFSVHAGMPALVYGPVAERIHAFDERVSLASLRRVTKTIALFAAGWCGVGAG